MYLDKKGKVEVGYFFLSFKRIVFGEGDVVLCVCIYIVGLVCWCEVVGRVL